MIVPVFDMAAFFFLLSKQMPMLHSVAPTTQVSLLLRFSVESRLFMLILGEMLHDAFLKQLCQGGLATTGR
jgi:hypothetical protein